MMSMRVSRREARQLGVFLQATAFLADLWREVSGAADRRRDFAAIIKCFEQPLGGTVGTVMTFITFHEVEIGRTPTRGRRR